MPPLLIFNGEVPERSNGLAWKACVPHKGTEGSAEGIPAGESLPNVMIYYAYILKSNYDGTYYYGSSSDVISRLKAHNKGKSRYTKGRRPWELHYKEEFKTRTEAVQRERFFKSIDGRNWLLENQIITRKE